MSNEELVQKFQSGNEKALDELTEKNTALIRFIANKFSIHCNYIDLEDLLQEGWKRFFQAINR